MGEIKIGYNAREALKVGDFHDYIGSSNPR